MYFTGDSLKILGRVNDLPPPRRDTHLADHTLGCPHTGYKPGLCDRLFSRTRHCDICCWLQALYHTVSLTFCASAFPFETWLKKIIFNSLRLLFIPTGCCRICSSINQGGETNQRHRVSPSIPCETSRQERAVLNTGPSSFQ